MRWGSKVIGLGLVAIFAVDKITGARHAWQGKRHTAWLVERRVHKPASELGPVFARLSKYVHLTALLASSSAARATAAEIHHCRSTRFGLSL
jgi:hypothetical protein